FDGFTASTPLPALTDDRDALLAVGMNGGPLPPEHGFPARLVVPGLYGFVSATKWVTELEVTRFDEKTAYWTDRGWDAAAPILVASRIEVPKPLATVSAGDLRAGGTAWAQRSGIERVEVRLDDGDWTEATLAEEVTIDTWRQWRADFSEVEPGSHTLTVRATDRDGNVQTAKRRDSIPNSATGHHHIHFRAAPARRPGAGAEIGIGFSPKTHPMRIRLRIPGTQHPREATSTAVPTSSPLSRSTTMKTQLRTRTATLNSAGAIGLLALSGCSGMGSDSGGSESENSESQSGSGESEMPDESGDASMDDADLVGSGCSAYAEQNPDGAGSVEGMAQDPVATAASNNPMLTTLTKAVSGEPNPDVDLVDTLNGDEFTVIAPVDDAFDAVPKDDLDVLTEDSDELTKVLTYHVIPGQLSPEEVSGEHETVEGSKVDVSGEGEDMKFDDAELVCGGVKT